MYLVRSIYAATPVACATAPLAVLFVVAVLMGLVRTVYAATTIARTAAMPTFASHFKTPFVCALYQKCRAATAIIEPCRTCRSCRIRMLILCLSVFSHKGQEKQEMIQVLDNGVCPHAQRQINCNNRQILHENNTADGVCPQDLRGGCHLDALADCRRELWLSSNTTSPHARPQLQHRQYRAIAQPFALRNRRNGLGIARQSNTKPPPLPVLSSGNPRL